MSTHSTLPLAAVLDTATAGPLRIALRKVIEEGAPLSINGDAVERAGLACLQVLVAGQATATAASVAFRIVRPSAALVDMATLADLGELVAA